LTWWVKRNPVPVPLLTAGSPTDAVPGAIGQPGTVVLFGNEDVGMGTFFGGRFNAGFWFDSENTFGIQGGYFFLSGRSVSRSIASDSTGSPVLANPFFNVVTGTEDSSLVAFPGLVAGVASLSLSTRLQGAEINGLYTFRSGPNGRLSLLAGFRYLDLHERLELPSLTTGIS